MSEEMSIPWSEGIDDFKRVIEAIVLVALEPVPVDLLAQLLEQPTARVDQWCDELAAEYLEQQRGLTLVRVAGGVRYQTADDLAPYVERFLLHDQRARLSGAALETLAIVAYKQPISRAQVASIRGVDPDGVLRTLQARGYVAEVARDDGPGQAILYGTSASFLEKLGLESLDDLPPIADYIPGPEVVEALEDGLRLAAEMPAPVIDDADASTSLTGSPDPATGGRTSRTGQTGQTEEIEQTGQTEESEGPGDPGAASGHDPRP